MAVQYLNGQLYDLAGPMQMIGQSDYNYVPGLGRAKLIGGIPSGQNTNNTNNNYNINNPFSSASSGGVSGTLQPYVNRMTQNANNALYGGLLGYQPSQLVAGDAGGTPVHPNPPQWRLPSAIPTPNQGQVGLLGPQANPQQQMGVFGNRSWMVA